MFSFGVNLIPASGLTSETLEEPDASEVPTSDAVTHFRLTIYPFYLASG